MRGQRGFDTKLFSDMLFLVLSVSLCYHVEGFFPKYTHRSIPLSLSLFKNRYSPMKKGVDHRQCEWSAGKRLLLAALTTTHGSTKCLKSRLNSFMSCSLIINQIFCFFCFFVCVQKKRDTDKHASCAHEKIKSTLDVYLPPLLTERAV